MAQQYHEQPFSIYFNVAINNAYARKVYFESSYYKITLAYFIIINIFTFIWN